MFSNKFYPNPENFTPSRMVWMVTFCKSGLECGKTFTGASDLNIHQITHTLYVLSVRKPFKIQHSLCTHANPYRQKPYWCTQCDKTFYSSSNLTAHNKSLSKTRERPFECPTCKKTFSMSSHLRN